jgi:hypothetical protein
MNSSAISIPLLYGELRDDRNWPRLAITIHTLGEIQQGQIGYRIAPDGRSLVGPGAWEQQWMVIGHDDLCGDPIFVDVTKPELPVFTASHGQGLWEAELIAQSAASFFESLNAAEEVQSGRLSRESGLSKIAGLNHGKHVDLEFWSVLMELQA